MKIEQVNGRRGGGGGGEDEEERGIITPFFPLIFFNSLSFSTNNFLKCSNFGKFENNNKKKFNNLKVSMCLGAMRRCNETIYGQVFEWSKI